MKLNLINSFPEKNEKEIKQIEKAFYRHLCDLFLESFKTLTISKKAMLEHCKMNSEAQQLFNSLETNKRSIILVMGHWGNWEWAGNTFSLTCKQQLYVIYHPIEKSIRLNKLMYKMRTRFGTKLIAMRDTYKDMVRNKNEVNATAFIADQTPRRDRAFWTKFLNQDTPVFEGTEKIAKKMNYPVVYAGVKKIKRGYYEVFAEMLTYDPSKTMEGEITELHTKRLEKDILEKPETWLWSHRRWKHKKPASSIEESFSIQNKPTSI